MHDRRKFGPFADLTLSLTVQALPSTAVTHAINVPNLTSDIPGAASLVVAKGNTIEVWDLTPEGLVEICKTDVWGMVVGLEWVGKPVSCNFVST